MRTNILVGPAGWSYEDWKGVVYPATRPRGFHEAAYLARFFPVIEINTSFYRPLRPELARLWAKKIEDRPGFRFTAKLYRGFTHERNLDPGVVREFAAGLAPLAEAGRLGCVLMQFPHSFHFNRENLAHLLKIRRAFPGIELAAEFRHDSWNRAEALEALAEGRVSFCNIDQPRLPRCLPPTAHVTGPVGYVRLHGRNDQEWFDFDESKQRPGGLKPIEARYNYLYTREQLESWKPRIEQVAERTKAVYVVTNNHFRGQAVVNALQLIGLIQGEKVEAPPQLLDHYPELAPAARNRPAQGSLFCVSRSRGRGPASRKESWAGRAFRASA